MGFNKVVNELGSHPSNRKLYIYMSVCMYVCLYVYMYVYMSVCKYVCMYVCMYVCINTLWISVRKII